MRVSGRKKGHLSSSSSSNGTGGGDVGLGMADIDKLSVTKKKKAKRCGECTHCKRNNCGVCARCLDMVMFGGSGKKFKMCCQERVCINMEVAVRTRQ